MSATTIAGIEFTPHEDGWRGTRAFPHLAKFTEPENRGGGEPEDDEEMQQLLQKAEENIDRMKAELGLPADFEQQFAAVAEKHGLFDEIDDEDADFEPDEEDERQRELNRQGIFHVSVLVDEGEQPSTEQRNALEYLAKHEERLCENLLDAVLRYYRYCRKDDPDWFELHDCPPVDSADELVGILEFDEVVIRPEHFNGSALVGFSFSCDWDMEHGFGVCMHEDVVVDVGDWEAAHSGPYGEDSMFMAVATKPEKERIRRAAQAVEEFCAAAAEDHEPTDHDRLVQAVMEGDEATVKRLSEAGVSINDCAGPAWHPIFIAISDMNPAAVRTMIDLGSDLSVKNDERKTPLKFAEEQLKNMRFAREMTGMLSEQLAGQLEEDGLGPAQYEKRAEEIVAIVRQAGG